MESTAFLTQKKYISVVALKEFLFQEVVLPLKTLIDKYHAVVGLKKDSTVLIEKMIEIMSY